MVLVALARVTVGGRLFEPGEELPADGVDRERLVRLGVAEEAKPKARGRGRGKTADDDAEPSSDGE